MLLNIENVSKSFGGVHALDNVSFSIGENETVGLIGPNGAGKTTLTNVIFGSMLPDTGKIELDSKDITSEPAYKRCHAGISRTYQIPQPFPELTALHNVAVAVLHGKHKTDITFADVLSDATHYLGRVGLFGKRNILARDLTLYDLRVLELGRALATTPKLVLIDEVMAGLNPGEASRAVTLIEHLKEDHHLTILWIEHVMSVIMKAADRVIVLDQGKKIAEGLPRDVVENPVVVEAYLGRKHA